MIAFGLYGVGALVLIGTGWFLKGKFGKQVAVEATVVDTAAKVVVADVKKV